MRRALLAGLLAEMLLGAAWVHHLSAPPPAPAQDWNNIECLFKLRVNGRLWCHQRVWDI